MVNIDVIKDKDYLELAELVCELTFHRNIAIFLHQICSEGIQNNCSYEN